MAKKDLAQSETGSVGYEPLKELQQTEEQRDAESLDPKKIEHSKNISPAPNAETSSRVVPEKMPQIRETVSEPSPSIERGKFKGKQTQTSTEPQATVMSKSQMLQEIEGVLAEGLEDVYQQMTPEQQVIFRTKGEEIASLLEKYIRQCTARARQVLQYIRGWLALIPGVNELFLEQESKIKTDRLLALQTRLKKKS